MPFNPKKLKSFPQQPGVYLMKDTSGRVLYVGKAKNLRQRVRQYFASGGDGREMIPYLIAKVHTIETIVVSSEKEALLLEHTLIQQHQPSYNAFFKDDKSYVCLQITQKHEWPQIELVRYREKPKGGALHFGPYTSAGAARETLDLLNRLFPLRQCSDRELARRTRPCILYQMHRCVAPCVGLCTKEEYQEHVQRTVRFLRGQDKQVLRELRQDMEQASEALEYEKAGAILQRIRYIEKTIEKQRVTKVQGGDADVLGLFREGDEVVVAQLLYRNGRLISSHHYNLSKVLDDDAELLTAFLLQHYENKVDVPREILLPIQIGDSAHIAEILSVQLHTPQRGEKRKMVEIAQKNAVATFRKEKDEATITQRTLVEMQEKFRLRRYPSKIECIDISHLSGSEPVAALIAFAEGKKETRRYRKYKLKETDPSDDYGAMREVLRRRYARAKEENSFPDLLIIDGGKGHLNVAIKCMQELDIVSVDLIGLAKEEGRHDRGMTLERVFLPNVKDPITFKRNSPILFLLQRIRDESHRFAITFQRQRRSKQIVTSELAQVPGIGPVKQKRLLKHFGSVKGVKKASKEELAEVSGISKRDAEAIKRILSS